MVAMPVQKTPRWIERRAIPEPAHLQALDTDIDNLEAAVLIAQSNHEVLAGKLDRMNARLLGMVLSLLGASLTLLANLAFHR